MIGTEHLLLSLLRDDDNIAAQILHQFNIHYDVVRGELDNIINGKPSSPQQQHQPAAEKKAEKSKTPVLDNFGHDLTKLRPDQMVRDDLSERDLYPFNVPSAEECERVGVYGIHLGDYIFWDDERQTEFVRDVYGWRETQIEGSYKRYKSAECIMPGVHDLTCYLKPGYGRATFHASVAVRAGLLSRDEAWELIRETESKRPEGLDYYLKITGMSEEEFHNIMEGHKRPELKNVVIPIHPKTEANEERILPYPKQLIEKFRNEDR